MQRGEKERRKQWDKKQVKIKQIEAKNENKE